MVGDFALGAYWPIDVMSCRPEQEQDENRFNPDKANQSGNRQGRPACGFSVPVVGEPGLPRFGQGQ